MGSADAGIRAELHVHSRASTDTGSWFLNRAVLPESYTTPEGARETAKSKGMDFIALTDHNTLAGVAEIAHHPDVIVGVEATCKFPEDAAELHVLIWGLDEPQWNEIDRLRDNIYEVLDYLRTEGLPHSLAHPLHRVGGDFTADHLERCLLLFPAWEGRNGARPRITNEVAVRIARSAGPDYLVKLAERHGLEPVTEAGPALTGGSDDHSGFAIANAWTEMPPATTKEEVVAHLREGRTAPGGAHGSSLALAHSVSTLFVKGHLDEGGNAVPNMLRGIVGDILEHPVPRLPETEQPANGEKDETFGAEIMRRIRKDPRLVRKYKKLGKNKQKHERLRFVTGWLHGQLIDTAVSGGETGGYSRRLEAFAGAAGIAAPYFLAASYLRGEIAYSRDIEKEFFGSMTVEPPRVMMLTDTFDELNGVAGTMRRMADFAGRNPDAQLIVVDAGEKADEEAGHIRLKSASSIQMPAYGDPDWRLGIPSALDMVDLIEEREIDIVHAATPGPMGLAGLLVARSLGLPFVATYHTELARYALDLSGDRFFAQICARGVGWFYGQAERVYVPTQSTAEGLVASGIDRDKLVDFTRGVDTHQFGPDRGSWWTRRKMGGKDATVLLYVGRLSREKGVPLLAEAFRRAAADRPDLRLAIVGKGPGRAEVEGALKGTPHKLLGPLTGDDLAAAYASADIFCLPSETETFGQVAVEAAASGLPVITVDRGAAHERVVDGETGLVATAGDASSLADAIGRLADDRGLRERMGRAARSHIASTPSWDDVFRELVSGYPDLQRVESVNLLSSLDTAGRETRR